MEYRTLGRSGLKVSALTLGTITFGGKGKFAEGGTSDVKEAEEIVWLRTARTSQDSTSYATA